MRSSLAGFCLLFLACSDGDSEKEKQLVAVDAFFRDVAAETCNFVFRCCEDSEIGAFKTVFLDRPGCDAYFGASFKTESYLYRLAVSQGGVRADETALRVCVDAIKALACGKNLITTGAPTVTTVAECAMAKLFLGARQAGEVCESSLDCAKGNRCHTSSLFTGKGVCVPFRLKGEPCSSSKECDSTATPPLMCSYPKQSPASCRPLAGAGEPCLEVSCDSTVVPALYCDSAADPKNPICVQRILKRAGETCTSPSECEKGLFCDILAYPSTRTCLALKKNGEPCQSTGECESARCDYGKKTCGSALCDGRDNGPPVQLDVGVVPPKLDYPYPKYDYYYPKPDRGPDLYPKADKFIWPDLKPKSDLKKGDTFSWPMDL